MSLAWYFSTGDRPAGGKPAPDVASAPAAKPSAPAGTERPDASLVSGRAPQAAPAKDELDWDDSLDEEIALAGQKIVSIQQEWYGVDDAYSTIRQGLEQVEKEIENGNL